jgi:hypothetical protein
MKTPETVFLSLFGKAEDSFILGSFTICALEVLLDNKNDEVEKGGICDIRERERRDMHTEF